MELREIEKYKNEWRDNERERGVCVCGGGGGGAERRKINIVRRLVKDNVAFHRPHDRSDAAEQNHLI